jgi:hypothetical protein
MVFYERFYTLRDPLSPTARQIFRCLFRKSRVKHSPNDKECETECGETRSSPKTPGEQGVYASINLI